MNVLLHAYQSLQLFAQNMPRDMRFPEEFQNGPPPEMMGAVIAGLLIFFAVLLFVMVLISVVVCYFIYKPLSTVPEQYQKISPAMVWLLLIPLFNLVWGFFVYPRVSQSLKQYAAARGNHGLAATDCGETLGWIIPSLVVAGFLPIPIVGLLIPLANLVILILYLVKINQIAGELGRGYDAASAYAAPGAPMPGQPPYPGQDDFS